MRLSETELAATRSISIDTRARKVVVRQPPTTTVFSAGDSIAGRYRVKRFIARGGMGEVYEAEDMVLGVVVALKAIRSGSVSEHSIRRFRTEVQLARRVTHPNVCRLFDVGTHDGVDFLTMELLAGVTLSDRLDERGRLAVAEARPFVEQIVAGLAAAHEVGVVHRDLKSHNVMLVPAPRGGERAVITDFGLALHEDDGEAGGEVAGSPAYMAPEQVVGGRISPATDVYALGVVMYEMVTGKLPFVGDSAIATAQPRLDRPAPSPRGLVADLDTRWEKAILKCLERVPGDRYASAAEVAGALLLPTTPPAAPRRTRHWLGLALALVVGTGGVGALWWKNRAPAAPAAATRTGPTLADVAAMKALVAKSIRVVDADHVIVERDLVLWLSMKPEATLRTTRFVPTSKNGAWHSYSLYAIEPGSLAERLGFQNGDKVTTIAEVPLDHASAFEDLVVPKLMSAPSADIVYTRRGETRTLHVTLVDGAAHPVTPSLTTPEAIAALVHGGVRVVDERHAQVTRAVVTSVLAEPAYYAYTVTPRAWLRGKGDQVGYQLHAVAEGSLAAALGFKTGDVVHEVAGVKLDSEPAYQEKLVPRLPTLGQLDVAYERDEKPRTLHIDVVDALPAAP